MPEIFSLRYKNLQIQRMSGKGRIGAMVNHGKLKQSCEMEQKR